MQSKKLQNACKIVFVNIYHFLFLVNFVTGYFCIKSLVIKVIESIGVSIPWYTVFLLCMLACGKPCLTVASCGKNYLTNEERGGGRFNDVRHTNIYWTQLTYCDIFVYRYFVDFLTDWLIDISMYRLFQSIIKLDCWLIFLLDGTCHWWCANAIWKNSVNFNIWFHT